MWATTKVGIRTSAAIAATVAANTHTGPDGSGEPAVAIVYYPEGCICWPDPTQALCLSHTMKGLDNNTGHVIAWLTGTERQLLGEPSESVNLAASPGLKVP